MVHLHDTALIQQALEGKKGYEELIRRYQNKVYGTAFQILGHSADAEDVAQEAFVRAYMNLDRFDVNLPFEPWVMRITVNLCLTLIKKRKNLPRSLSPSDEPMQQKEKALFPKLSRQVIFEEVDRLKPNYRVSFILFHFKGFTYEQIAAAMGVAQNNVKNYLHRARRALRKVLADRLLLAEEKRHEL